MKIDLDTFTPKQIVEELDKYIIGQDKAKRAVAIALRNRMRRQRLPEELRDEVAPKNIIMIGPTGVGKTEIARRLSKLCGAPFIKVEATKYTEVGYVGRDVESMVRDLASVAVSMVKAEMQVGVRAEAELRAEEQLLDLLLPGSRAEEPAGPLGFVLRPPASRPTAPDRPASKPAAGGLPAALPENRSAGASGADPGQNTREKFRERLHRGELDDKLVEVSVTSRAQMPAIEIFSGTSFEEMDVNLSNLANLFGGKKKKKKVTLKQAREILLNEEMDKLVDMEHVSEAAIERVEQMGIIFVDEIDKIASKENHSGIDVSREGVQRDILPIVEGSKVNTRYGMVDTRHILFIAAGAFHMSKPSDLIPELQGRFPLRVELQALTAEDFRKILTQPRNALIIQYVELLRTEGVELVFEDEAIARISELASEVNSSTENIGARRLHTIMELVLEEISFHASETRGQTIHITRQYVEDRLKGIIEDRDMTRFIL
jgi:ATP-dependent HslUV protease ATP-binding subunit HslU